VQAAEQQNTAVRTLLKRVIKELDVWRKLLQDGG
jgi:hypothetical protein